MPYCVLVLRLIGLAFDVQDGAKVDEKDDKKSADQVSLSDCCDCHIIVVDQ
jgi:hypothetical protein